MIYFEYNVAVGAARRRTFAPLITSITTKVSEALGSNINKDWCITSSPEEQPGLVFALDYLATKAGTARDSQRFVIFAYSEEALITLRRCLQGWPKNARGVIVVLGEGKAKNFLSHLLHEVSDSKHAKDKILTVVAETVTGDPRVFRSIIEHLTKKK